MATAIPQNRAPFTVDEIALATGGRVVRAGAPSVGVCTDSRAITEGSAFVALVGDKFDGHAFLEGAAIDEASALMSLLAGEFSIVPIVSERSRKKPGESSNPARWYISTP